MKKKLEKRLMLLELAGAYIQSLRKKGYSLKKAQKESDAYFKELECLSLREIEELYKKVK